MDATLRELLQQIVAHPADDTARLVYADRCDDLGEHERGEFIRVQCELAKGARCRKPKTAPLRLGDDILTQHHIITASCGECDLCTQFPELQARERELFGHELGYALRDDHPWMRHTVVPSTYHGRVDRCCLYARGFISSLTCSAEDFLAHADKLVWHPEMTDECGTCNGSGELIFNSQHIACWDCKLEVAPGRIPRPMPDTAQPITRVKLTTIPNIHIDGIDAEDWAMMNRGVALALICEEMTRRYRVIFELPSLLHTA